MDISAGTERTLEDTHQHLAQLGNFLQSAGLATKIGQFHESSSIRYNFVFLEILIRFLNFPACLKGGFEQKCSLLGERKVLKTVSGIEYRLNCLTFINHLLETIKMCSISKEYGGT